MAKRCSDRRCGAVDEDSVGITLERHLARSTNGERDYITIWLYPVQKVD